MSLASQAGYSCYKYVITLLYKVCVLALEIQLPQISSRSNALSWDSTCDARYCRSLWQNQPLLSLSLTCRSLRWGPSQGFSFLPAVRIIMQRQDAIINSKMLSSLDLITKAMARWHSRQSLQLSCKLAVGLRPRHHWWPAKAGPVWSRWKTPRLAWYLDSASLR